MRAAESKFLLCRLVLGNRLIHPFKDQLFFSLFHHPVCVPGSGPRHSYSNEQADQRNECITEYHVPVLFVSGHQHDLLKRTFLVSHRNLTQFGKHAGQFNRLGKLAFYGSTILSFEGNNNIPVCLRCDFLDIKIHNLGGVAFSIVIGVSQTVVNQYLVYGQEQEIGRYEPREMDVFVFRHDSRTKI